MANELGANHNKKLMAFCLSILLSGVIFFSGPLAANPQNGVIVAGNASITHNANITEINQTTDKAIINWDSFSIGTGEETRFHQPSSSAIALNRVVGNIPSHILGRLSANGQIMLLNQAGIIFGAGSKIDVAGLIASTANITDQDFLAGHYRFTQNPQSTATIINEGEISVAERGLVALVAPGVENTGIIRANLGRVVLASGNNFTIDLYGDQLIEFEAGSEIQQAPVDVNGRVLKAAVTNNGAIYAQGGKVLLTAKTAEHIVDNVISMGGIIQATSASIKNGVVILSGENGVVEVGGKIYASGKLAGQRGGQVKVLAKKVHLKETAEIDVSGDAGGGEILVGGNYQGKGPELNAQITLVDQGALLDASALTNGDGGRVIIWADDYTNYAGKLLVRGGILSGNGGFAEVSGKEILAFHGRVDLTAPYGNTGTLLLDPRNVTIQTAGVTTATPSGSPTDTYTPTSDDSIVTIADLVSALAAANVTINTGSTGSQLGNITVADALSWSTGTTLTLTAANNINVNAAISNIGAGLTLTAANDININAAISGVGNIGAVTLNATNNANINANISNLATLVFNGTTIKLNTANISAESSQTYNNAVVLAASITIGGGGASTFNSTVNLGGNVLTLSSGTIRTFNDAISGIGGSIVQNANEVHLNAANSYTGGTTLTSGILRMGTNTSLGTGTIALNGGTLNYNDSLGSSDVANNYTVGGNVTVNGFSITLSGTGTLGLGNTLAADTQLTISGAISGAGNLQVNSGSSLRLLVANNYSGTTTVNGSGDLRVNDDSALGTSTLMLNGGTLQATSTRTITNTFNVGGTAAIGGSNNITFTGAGTLGSGNTLNVSTAGTVAFNNTLNGAGNLAVTGTTLTLGSTVGNSTALSSLTTSSGTTTNINGTGITTSGNQTYNGAIVLGANTSLTTATGNVTFGSTVNGAQNLSVNSGSGTISINGVMGGVTPLNSFTSNGAGTLQLGDNITTQGGTIIFNTPVVLTDNVALVDTGTTGIQFNNTLNGAFNLALTATQADIIFAGIVGGSTRLGNLTVTNAQGVAAGANMFVTNFTQNQGSGSSLFSNLNATNIIDITTDQISGIMAGNSVSLYGDAGITGQVTAGQLLLGGQSGGVLTNTVVNGISGPSAAGQVTLLLPLLAGDFFVNGCLVGGSCNVTSTSSASTSTTTIDATVNPDDVLPQVQANKKKLACIVVSESDNDSSENEVDKGNNVDCAAVEINKS